MTLPWNRGMRTGYALVGVFALALGVAGGCGDDGAGGSGPVCRVGDTRECLGPGACEGAQECLADGSGFQSCECGDGPNSGGGASDGGGPGSSTPGDAGSSSNPQGGLPGSEPAGQGGGAGEASVGGAGGAAVELACSPVGNDGCEAAQNCSVDAVEPECVSAGTTGVLEVCNQTSDCAVGLQCLFNNCVKTCGTNPDCGVNEPTLKCGLGITNPYVGQVSACVTSCNPLTQDCPNGQACYLGSCLTSTQGRAQGQACGLPTDCAEGLDCLADITQDGQPDCSQYCTVGAQNPCGTGFACYPLQEIFATVPATWGICVFDE